MNTVTWILLAALMLIMVPIGIVAALFGFGWVAELIVYIAVACCLFAAVNEGLAFFSREADTVESPVELMAA